MLRFNILQFEFGSHKNNGNASILNRLMFYIYNQFVKMNTRHNDRKNIMAHYDIVMIFTKYGWIHQ